MSVTSKIKQLAKLKRKAYRDAYVEEHVKTSLPFQIRTLREQREWSQRDLGEKTGMRQNAVSRLEKPDYGSLNVNTLLRLASAFDVALLIKFVPFRKLLDEFSDLSTKALEVSSFEQELPELEQITAITTWRQGSFRRTTYVIPPVDFDIDIAAYPVVQTETFQELDNTYRALMLGERISGMPGIEHYFFDPGASIGDALPLEAKEPVEIGIIDYTQAPVETPLTEAADLVLHPSVFARGGSTQHIN
jgi:transcriptional regulator with XRE-family HTH domain